MKTVAIMQPTYLPWAGYFGLIANADLFLLLDDVQFVRCSWQCRNRVLVGGQPHFLTVPTTGPHGLRINEVPVVENGFRKKQMRLLEQTYGKHPHGPEMLSVVLPVLNGQQTHLVELTVTLIARIAAALGILTPQLRTSSLPVLGKRSERVLQLLRSAEATRYVSAAGAREYIEEDGVLGGSGIQVEFQDFTAAPYPQKGTLEFVSHLSIVDVAANLGWAGARAYVTGNRESWAQELPEAG
jgi:WbqC-like protein family